MTKSIFITATDTEVGKTFISALLIKKLTELKNKCAYVKPFETGLGESFKSIDYSYVKRINPKLAIPEQESVIEKYYYALSPHDSAVLESRKPDIEKVLRQINKIKQDYEYTIIEGAGGVYVPVTGDYCIIDLIKQINEPCIVIGRLGLGTINHTILTIKALQYNKINVKAFILNGKGDTQAGNRNAGNIENFTKVPCAGIVGEINPVKVKLDDLSLDYNLIFDF